MPRAYDMPRPKGMTEQLGCDHRFRFTEFASLCSRVVLMSLTIRTATSNSNVFIPRFSPRAGPSPADPRRAHPGPSRPGASPTRPRREPSAERRHRPRRPGGIYV